MSLPHCPFSPSSNRACLKISKIICLELPGTVHITNMMLCISTVKYSSSPRFAFGCALLAGFLKWTVEKRNFHSRSLRQKLSSLKITFKNKIYEKYELKEKRLGASKITVFSPTHGNVFPDALRMCSSCLSAFMAPFNSVREM